MSFKQIFQFLLYVPKRRFRRRDPGDHDKVEAFFNRRLPAQNTETFLHKAFYAVPCNAVPDLSAYGDAQTVLRAAVPQNAKHQMSGRKRFTSAVNLPETAVLLNRKQTKYPRTVYAVSTALPFLRLLSKTFLPLLVFILLRNPCSLERCLVFG